MPQLCWPNRIEHLVALSRFRLLSLRLLELCLLSSLLGTHFLGRNVLWFLGNVFDPWLELVGPLFGHVERLDLLLTLQLLRLGFFHFGLAGFVCFGLLLGHVQDARRGLALLLLLVTLLALPGGVMPVLLFLVFPPLPLDLLVASGRTGSFLVG